MKGYIAVNIPERCAECEEVINKSCGKYCGLTCTTRPVTGSYETCTKYDQIPDEIYDCSRPFWCPIKQMPVTLEFFTESVEGFLEELKEYRDTGLKPSMVRKLKEWNTPRMASKTTDEKGESKLCCPNCGSTLHGKHPRFCSWCGQRVTLNKET